VKTFKNWLYLKSEAHHNYDDIEYETEFKPIKTNDTITVYHGFNNIEDTIKAVAQGLSGAERVSRRYSYEAFNNPKGLFVTIDKKTAEDFAGSGAVIEFDANSNDLHAPVWKGGNYGIQGQFVSTFPSGRKGAIERAKTKQELEKHAQDDPTLSAHAKQSDYPRMTSMLTSPSEYQALFTGHLNPENIKAVYVKEGMVFRKQTPKEFLADKDSPKAEKAFNPNDNFNFDVFFKFLNNRFTFFKEADLERIWNGIKKQEGKTDHFYKTFKEFLWPKQLIQAFFVFKEKYK